MLAGNSFPVFIEGALNMLMDWHELNPVSQKEIDRNNMIYDNYQYNRNPFIDHPEYVYLIWGDGTPEVSFSSTPNTAILYGTPTLGNVGVNGVEIIATANYLSKTQTFDINVLEGGSGGDWVETFMFMSETSSSYTTRAWTGDNDTEWSATNARTDQEIDSRAICLKDAGDTCMISQTLAGSVSSVTFEHQQKFSGSDGEITLFVNNQQIGETIAVSDAANSSTFSNITVFADFTKKLVSNGATSIAINNLGWTNLSNPPQSPVFGDISHTPESPLHDEEVTFLAVVTDADGTIKQVLLSYGSSAETLLQSTSMQHLSGNSYSVSLQLPLAELVCMVSGKISPKSFAKII